MDKLTLYKATDPNIELLGTTNHQCPISIEGVAQASITNKETGDSKIGMVVLYKVCGEGRSMVIDENTYKTIKALFDTIKDRDSWLIDQWVNDSAAQRMGR